MKKVIVSLFIAFIIQIGHSQEDCQFIQKKVFTKSELTSFQQTQFDAFVSNETSYYFIDLNLICIKGN